MFFIVITLETLNLPYDCLGAASKFASSSK